MNNLGKIKQLTEGLKAAGRQAREASLDTTGFLIEQSRVRPPLAIREQALARQRARRAADEELRFQGL